MRTRRSNQIIFHLAAALPVLFMVAVLLATIFSAPTSTHAGITIEPLWKVLGTNNNIKTVWTEVKNLVNVVVIAVLIFVAFTNILRIQINNYAVKKILPTLILAVILTNFSYFICRFMVDLANVALGLLMDGAAGASVKDGVVKVASSSQTAPGVAGAFEFSAYKVDPDNLWKSIIYILAEFIGAIFIFILSFLFFIRNYVIYFLVGLAPLAFMATILPQTKSIFNQWWGQFLRWTFMPIVSVFWLWLGGTWYSSGFSATSGGTSGITQSGIVPGADFNSDLFALAFASICYYLAITTPFKMGGAIMGKWADLGKKAWGRTGGALWNATGGAIYNYNKEKMQTNFNARRQEMANRLKQATGIGYGLDAAQQRLAIAETRKGRLSEQGKARYINRHSGRIGMQEALDENLSTTQTAMKKAMFDAADRAEHGYQGKNKVVRFWNESLGGDKRFKEKIEKARMCLQEGILESSNWELDWKRFNNEMKMRFLTDPTDEVQKTAGGEEIRDANGNLVTRSYVLDAHGNKIYEPGKANNETDEEYRQSERFKNSEYGKRVDFFDNYGKTIWQSQVKESEANKLSDKKWEKVIESRLSLNTSQEDLETAKGTLGALRRIEELLKKGNDRDEKDEEELHTNLGLLQGRGHGAALKYDENDKFVGFNEEKGEDGKTAKERVAELIEEEYDTAKKSHQARMKSFNEDNLPVYVQDMFERDAKTGAYAKDEDGNLKVRPMSSLEFKRSSKIYNSEVVAGGAQRISETYSPQEIALAAQHGRDGIVKKEHADAAFSGNIGQISDTGDVEGVVEFMHAFARAQASRPELLSSIAVNKYAEVGNNVALSKIGTNINESLDIMARGKRPETVELINGMKIDHLSSDPQKIAESLHSVLTMAANPSAGIDTGTASNIRRLAQGAVNAMLTNGGAQRYQK